MRRAGVIDTNPIDQLNNLENGLNFVVSKQWWNDLLDKNKKISDFRKIVIPECHPLEVLQSFEVIRTPPDDNLMRQISSISGPLEATVNEINKQVRKVLDLQKVIMHRKTGREQFRWRQIIPTGELRQLQKMLICPQVHSQILDSLVEEDSFWKIVSPRMYKLICQKTQIQQFKNTRFIFGIPIFLQNIENMPINDGPFQRNHIQQFNVSICYHNLQKGNYGVLGFVQNIGNYKEMMRYLYEGLQILFQKQTLNLNCLKGRSKIYKCCGRTYYSGQDHQYYTSLRWINFQKLREHGRPGAGNYDLKIIEISYYNDLENQINISDNQSQLFRFRDPSKKIKQSFPQQIRIVHQLFKPKIVKTSEFTPISHKQIEEVSNKLRNIGKQSNNKKEQRQRFNDVKKNNPQFIAQRLNKTPQPQVINVQLHSSTQGETPDNFIQQALINDFSNNMRRQRQVKRDEERIHHPLWKDNSNIEALRKLSQLTMRKRHEIPFKVGKKKVIIDKLGNRIYFQHECNKLKWQSDELVQQQMPQKMDQQHTIPQDIINELQELARGILGQRVIEQKDIVIKEEVAETIKEKNEIESQTCKNEDINDLESMSSIQSADD